MAAASLLIPVPSLGSGWACDATGTWSSCPEDAPTACDAHTVDATATRADRDLAEIDAVEACRTRMSSARLSDLWNTTPGRIHRVDQPCAPTGCVEVPAFSEDPARDAFDDPVCVGVRRYVCALCGTESPLCVRVQRERPVTTLACADTWVELEAFVGVLEQFDARQPGALRTTVEDLCGTAPAEAPDGEAPPE